MRKRPYIICLMATSVDGKILTEKWGNNPHIKKLISHFEQAHNSFGIGAWLVGRTTMEKDFTKGAKPIIKKGHHEIPRVDFVGDHQAKTFAITIDGHAKLGWEKPALHGDHVITILTESVSDGYLAHLRDIGVSYCFAGTETVDLTIAMEKLESLFGIGKLMLEGGGRINGSFLNEGLIDEYHQLILPIADGTIETSSVFEIAAETKKTGARPLKLAEVTRLTDDVLLLKYLPTQVAAG